MPFQLGGDVCCLEFGCVFIPSLIDAHILCLSDVLQSASQVHAGHFAAGFVDGCVKLFDIRMPEL